MNKHIIGLTHIALKCNDFDKMCAFYRDTMELKPAFTLPYKSEIASANSKEGVKEGDAWIAYFKVTDRQFVELINEKYASKYQIPEYSFMHFSILVEDIVEAARHFEDKGVTLWAGPSFINNPHKAPYKAEPVKCGSYAFYIQDPEGNEIEIMQYTEQSMQLNCDISK